jgi:hypothetical protein
MRILRPCSAPSASRLFRAGKFNHRQLPSLVIPAFIVMVSLSAGQVCAQAADRIARTPDLGPLEKLANHHPAWAVPANDTGIVPADRQLDNLTLVLARSPEQEQAFEQLLKDQQDPSSPEFHHWLTPGEIGERFGLSPGDIATVASWLQSQRLRVNWVAPSGIFIGFGGTAADLGRAFQTEFHFYNVKGRQRISVASDPTVPVALAPVIRAVRGLFTPGERPNHFAQHKLWNSPAMTFDDGGLLFAFVAPADFALIYDLPSSLTGAGTTIGLVEQARTDMADFTNFKIATLTTFANPTEVIPTAFGGVDPGPAYTAPPACEEEDDCSDDVNDYLGDQAEATLDVQRAGSTAPGAAILLVTASEASGGISVAAQYLVNTSPVPAQVMSISFGGCELDNGLSAVEFFDSLFQQAAAEGISVFVSSGDSGAAGCDEAFAPPPANPEPNSPNCICSSSYATCVGGTEFNDPIPEPTPCTSAGCIAYDPQYWSATNGPGFLSALGYIPEGAWNDSLFISSSNPDAIATGGGVSIYIPTPSWQTGTGVPSPGTGRYTPDVSFHASYWESYVGCWAAGGGNCEESNGFLPLEFFSGTSASAPSMAGVAALLDQSTGSAQGNLNPGIYLTAARFPAAFHDVTVASSGVSACSLNTASKCNNSIPWTNPAADGDSGAQEGYQVQTGYDEATGWGSLDIAKFIDDYSAQPITPSVTVTPSSSSITTAQSLQVSVAVSAGLGLTPAGSVVLTSGTYSQSSALSGGAASILIPAGSLAVGTDTLSVAYTPSTITPSIFTSATGSSTVTVTAATGANPLVAWNTPAPITYGTPLSVAQLDATASVPGTFSYSPAAGTVLTAGSHFLTVNFTPNDTTGYATATSMVTITVNKASPSITWPTPAPMPFGTLLSATQLDATANVPGSFAYSLAVGAGLTAGRYTLTATFTPADSTDYTTATASVTLTVSKATTTVSSWPTASAISYGQSLASSTLSGGGNGSGTFDGTVIDVPGAFAWTAPGTVPAGTGSFPESVTFTPDDSSDFTSVSGTVSVEVNKATPTIRWATPAAITYGTALSATQLDASSTVAGTLVYSPAAGTVLGAGQHMLQVTLTPTDTSDYSVVTDSTLLVVNMVTPTVTAWPAASAISYGQTLANSTLTGGSASVSGTFAWTDPATRPGAGSFLQSVTFTPNDSTDYSSVSGSVPVEVNVATPVIIWPAPTAIYYGTALSATQLDASSTVAGTFVYSPAAGTVPAAGNDTLSVTLTPADTADYTTATASVNLIVINPTPSFGLSASPANLSVAQEGTGTFTITVSDVGGFSGAVTLGATGLPSGVTASFAAGSAAGTQVMTLSASSTATLGGPVTVTVTGTSGALSATVTVSLSVTAGPTFGPSGASGSDGPISVDPGAMTGNTSTISVVGINGFSGAVNLSCSISPAAASDPATCSLSPASVTLSGSTAQTSTLTVTTTATTIGVNQMKKLFWRSAGGTALALLLMIGIPRRRRNWLAMVGLAVVFASISAVGCGQVNGVSGGGGGGGGNAGTSAGTYTVTVTGTGTSTGSSSSVTATVGSVALTVN